jgi:hypothetical protein
MRVNIVAMSSRSRSARTIRHSLAALMGVAVLLAGCGGSSKPAYCSDVTNFEDAVTQLKNVSSPSALVSQTKKVVSSGQTAIKAVKTSFAPEADALKNSLTTLANSVKELSSSGTRASALQRIPAEKTAVVTAADNFANAAKPKCS